MAWIKFHEKLRGGGKRDLSRATRFIYLELCMEARKRLDVRDDGSAWIPISAKGTPAQAIRDLIGGNAMEIRHAVEALTAGEDPMLAVVQVPRGRSRDARYIIIHAYKATFMSADSWSKDHYAAAYERDGSFCRYCGAEQHLSIDHVVPRVHGGGDDLENLVVACRSCNSKKGGRTPEQAGMTLRPGPSQETL